MLTELEKTGVYETNANFLTGALEESRAGGNRTLMTSRPGDFKSPASTVSPPPRTVVA